MREDFTMKKIKEEVVYIVTYLDDDNKKHMTFVKGFSAVRFLEDRFENIFFEKTDNFSFDDEEREYFQIH